MDFRFKSFKVVYYLNTREGLLLNYKNITKEYVKAPIKIKIFLWFLFLILFFSNSVKASSINTSDKIVSFYTRIVNYTLPLVKITSSAKENIEEDQLSFKNKFLKIFGISFTDPYTIMGKEVCYLRGVNLENSENGEGNEGEIISLDPFKLGQNSVGKINTKATQDQGKQETDIPDKEVVIDNPALKKNTTTSKPEVLIYHSHNSEGYGLGGVNDTWDNSKNVTGVGESLTKELQEKYGISVVHDETVHNTVYDDSYLRSGQTLAKYLKTFGDFKLVIDMHRDSSIVRSPVITKLNGEIVAKYEFVMCKGNPHFQKNMMAVNKLMSISEKLFPGLLRDCPGGKGVYYYNIGKSYYNQDKSNNAMLIEVGSNMNTPAEANATAKYLARIIAEYINGKN